jgi:tetratricopeptide (TPR) repeat protein
VPAHEPDGLPSLSSPARTTGSTRPARSTATTEPRPFSRLLDGIPLVDFTQGDAGWRELYQALVAIDSPKARLESLEMQRDAFARKASNATEAVRERYRRKVDEFDARIAQERWRAEDPERSDREVAEGIRLGQARESAGDATPVNRSGLRIVNEPPPLLPNQFLDRVLETGQLEDRLRDPAIRLVAIVGPDGIGKTAMVSRLLDDLRTDSGQPPVEAFVYLPADGSRPIGPAILLEDLSKVVPEPAVAAHLNDRLNDSRLAMLAKLDVALEQLAGTRVVVVIDDAEELLDKGLRLRDDELDELVRALLIRRDHGVKLVMVAREAPEPLLREVSGNASRLELDKGLPLEDAKRFLSNLDGDGILGLETASDEQLQEAWRLTDGNPRALELAYSVLESGPEATLPELLDDMDGVPDDEDTLNYLVGRLFDRLEQDDRRVMQALAVYRRPVLPAAVDYLLRWYLDGFKSEPTLRRLLDRRLIRQDGDRYYLPRSPDGERVLDGIPVGQPTDRDLDPPPLTRLALLHVAAGYFVDARKRRVERIGDLAAWFAEIDLRIRGQDYTKALRLIYEIDRDHLTGWGQSDTVAYWREELVGKVGDEALELHSLSWLAHARRLQEKLEQAKELLEDAVTRATHLGDKKNLVRLHNDLGSVHFENGEVGKAEQFYKQALRGARRQEMKLQAAKAKDGLLLCAAETGRFPRALELRKEALAALRSVQDKDKKEAEIVEADLLLNLGGIQLQLGQNDEALGSLRNGRELARRLREDLLEGLILNAKAQLLIDGHPAQAIAPATEAVAIGASIRSPQLSREANATLALANLCAGNLNAAREAADAAARYQRNRRVLGALALQGTIAFRKGDPEGARDAFRNAHMQAEMLRDRERKNYQVLDLDGLVLCGLALCGERDRFRRAIMAYEDARKITREPGVVRRTLRLLNELARESDEPEELTKVRRAATGSR